MHAIRDGQTRYLVHFADGGSGMRWYAEPLEEAGKVSEGGTEYVVTRVEQPKGPNGLGHAWAEARSL
jgi:hypothetical protein